MMTARQQELAWGSFTGIVVAIMIVIAIVPPATAQVVAQVCAIVGGVLLCAAVAQWAVRRRQAGRALATLEPLSGTAIAILALLVGLVLVAGDSVPRDLFVVVLAWAVFGTAHIVGRVRACERGLLRGNRFLPWASIVSYGFEAPAAAAPWRTGSRIVIRYRPSPGTRLRSLTVGGTPEAQAIVGRLLAEHVPASRAG